MVEARRYYETAEEILALRLAVMHNLYFYNKLAQRIRDSLDAGCFEDFRREYSEKLSRRICRLIPDFRKNLPVPLAKQGEVIV